jgi:putative tryptophan/tyrosine transport system substrate-binding protein
MHFHRWKRREFITMLGGTAAWPLAARAQQPAPIRPLIGMLSPLSATAATRNTAAFRSALRDLGHVEGRNATLELRFGDGSPERMAPLARELIALKPDVLFAGAKSGAMAAHAATRTIPIVIIIPEDPVALGLVGSIARPSGNVTGTWALGGDELIGKRVEFLQLAVPGISRLGLLYNPDDPTDAVAPPRLRAVTRALGLTFQAFEVRDVGGLDAVSAQVVGAGMQALFVGQGPAFNSHRAKLTAMAARLRLPAVYGWREFAEAGGLMSYGPSLPDLYRQSARLVDRILKGASPGDLPIELPTRYELIVNLKAAKAIGLMISDSFLLLADEVIE